MRPRTSDIEIPGWVNGGDEYSDSAIRNHLQREQDAGRPVGWMVLGDIGMGLLYVQFALWLIGSGGERPVEFRRRVEDYLRLL